MIIILEGPDGTGKTTLGEQLAPILNRKLIHFGGRPKDLTDFHLRLIFMLEHGDNCIFDRLSQVGELVYGSTIRAMPIIHSTEIIGQLKLLASLPVLIIYTKPPKPVIFEKMKTLKTKKHKSAGHIDSVLTHSMSIIEGYDRIMWLISEFIPVEEYNYLEEDANSLFKRLSDKYFINESISKIKNSFNYGLFD